MRQLQFIIPIPETIDQYHTVTMYFLTDEDLFATAADFIEAAEWSEQVGKYQLRIMPRRGIEKSFYTNRYNERMVRILGSYCRRKREAEAICEARFSAFWRIAGGKWKITVTLRQMEKMATMQEPINS